VASRGSSGVAAEVLAGRNPLGCLSPIAEVTGRSGEKRSLRRVTVYTAVPNAALRTYVCSNDRIAVLVEVVDSSVTPAATSTTPSSRSSARSSRAR
ncbi:MAG: hypothetical protein R3A48_25445, partial [Polyangiales bacterium]